MMRLWLSRNSAASLRDQLATQLMLGVISEELKAGEKLPSVRELARRCQIHANTVSAAYRELANRGWLEFKKGSGVFVRDLRASTPAKQSPKLDDLIEQFVCTARAHGFGLGELRAKLAPWLAAYPVHRLVVLEPEPELCEILVCELQGRLRVPVTGLRLNKDLPIDKLSTAAVVALVSRANAVRAALPAGVPYHLLRLRSVPESLQGQQRPKAEALIAIASRSPEILRMTRTILIAAALDLEALEFRDAREEGWKNGLDFCEFVIADTVTAAQLPASCRKRIVRVLAEASVVELRRFLDLVTHQEVS